MKVCCFAGDNEGSHGKPVRSGISNLVSAGLVRIGSPDQHFYVEVKPITRFWDPATEAIHKMTREYLARYGMDARDAMLKLAGWVNDTAGSAEALYVSMPLTYDWKLLELCFRDTGVENPFAGALDGRAVFRHVHGLSRRGKVRRTRFEREYPTTIPHLHHALGDALEWEEQAAPLLLDAALVTPP